MRDDALNDVGEFLTTEILRSVGDGKSPVAGMKDFKALSEEYANDEKGGNRKPNLQLEGDMLSSLEYKVNGPSIEIGIFDGSEVGKADGHNNFSGESKLPTRRFIPKGRQAFNETIRNGYKNIIRSYARQEQAQEILNVIPEFDNVISPSIGIEVTDLLGPSLFDGLFDGES